jgi:hypothetical protein
MSLVTERFLHSSGAIAYFWHRKDVNLQLVTKTPAEYCIHYARVPMYHKLDLEVRHLEYPAYSPSSLALPQNRQDGNINHSVI